MPDSFGGWLPPDMAAAPAQTRFDGAPDERKVPVRSAKMRSAPSRAGERRGPEEARVVVRLDGRRWTRGGWAQVTIEDDSQATQPCAGAGRRESMDLAQSVLLKTIALSKKVPD